MDNSNDKKEEKISVRLKLRSTFEQVKKKEQITHCKLGSKPTTL